MNDVIKKLTAEQALDVVKRLSEKGGEIGEALVAEARNLLTAVNMKRWVCPSKKRLIAWE